jgi:hypothetical protein
VIRRKSHPVDLAPRRGCPNCHGDGGRWTGGPFPEMEACGPCDRPERQIPLQQTSDPWPDEPPF